MDEFHIGISYQKDVPDEIVTELVKTIKSDGLKVRSEPREVGMYMSMEWAILSIIVVYLSKSYFESFLKEAGKDHYYLLKKGFLKLFERIFGNKSEDRGKKRSQLFSIIVRASDDKSIKFIFPEGIELKEYELALDKLLVLLEDHYECFPSDEISKIVSKLQKPSNSYYIEFSSQIKKWILIDPLVEARKTRRCRKT